MGRRTAQRGRDGHPEGQEKACQRKERGRQGGVGDCSLRTVGQERQIDHSSSHGQLEQDLGGAPAARFAQAPLHQPGKGMFGRLAAATIVREGRTGLERSRRLQQRFLGMDLHAPAAVSADALVAKGALAADDGGKMERVRLFWSDAEGLFQRVFAPLT